MDSAPQLQDERTLLAGAREGDAEAFCRLAEQYDSRLLRQVMSLCHNLSSAQELVQQTLIEAWKSLSRFDERCRFSTWLFSILVHRYQKSWRYARSRPIPWSSLPSSRADEISKELNPRVIESPDLVLVREEQKEALRQLLDALPPKHQEVIWLRFFEDVSLEEIASALGLPLGMVKSRLHHGLETMNASNPFGNSQRYPRFSGWNWVFGAWLVLLAALFGVTIVFSLGLVLRGTFLLHMLFLAWLSVTIGLLIMVLLTFLVRARLRWLFTPAALHVYLYSSAVLFSLVILFYSIERWRGYRAWAILQSELKRSGENLDPVGLPPAGLNSENNLYQAPAISNLLDITYPVQSPVRFSVPVGNSNKLGLGGKRNERWLFNLSASWKRVGSAWARQQFLDLEAVVRVWQGRDLTTQESLASPAAAVMQVLNAHRELLNDLREAAHRPYAWPYQSPLNIYQGEPTHYAWQRILYLRASAALAQGQSSEPMQDILAALSMANHAWQLPSPRILEYWFLVQPIWDGLAWHRWNSLELDALERSLSQMDILAHHPSVLRKMLLFDMALLNQIFPIMESEPLTMPPYNGLEEEGSIAIQVLRWIYPQGWMYLN